MAKRPTSEPQVDANESLEESTVIQLRVFYEKHRNKIAATLLIAAACFFALSLYQSRQRQILEDSWGRLATATSPASYRNIADDYAGQPVAQLALLSAADLLLSEASTTRAADAGDVDIEGNLTEAGRLYRRALDEASQPLIRVNALLGLAAVAEGQQKWDEAQGFYDQARDAAAERFPFLVNLADQRLAMLPDLRDGVVIVETSILDELGVSEEADAEPPADAPAIEVPDLPSLSAPPDPIAE
jgi:predicted negative regulator of RcsB-dependent stress response